MNYRQLIIVLCGLCWSVFGLGCLPQLAAPVLADQRVSRASILPLLERAREKFELNKYSSALDYYQQALKIDASNPRVQFGLGSTYLALGEWSLAREHLLSALELNPALLEAYYGLAYIAAINGEQTSALRYYRQGLGLEVSSLGSSGFNRVELGAAAFE